VSSIKDVCSQGGGGEGGSTVQTISGQGGRGSSDADVRTFWRT